MCSSMSSFRPVMKKIFFQTRLHMILVMFLCPTVCLQILLVIKRYLIGCLQRIMAIRYRTKNTFRHHSHFVYSNINVWIINVIIVIFKCRKYKSSVQNFDDIRWRVFKLLYSNWYFIVYFIKNKREFHLFFTYYPKPNYHALTNGV